MTEMATLVREIAARRRAARRAVRPAQGPLRPAEAAGWLASAAVAAALLWLLATP